EGWLSTISQYSRKIKHWNRFRDVSCAFVCLFVFVCLFFVCVCGDIWSGRSWGSTLVVFSGGGSPQ
ncbi:unnamed protein product, partial [Tetraodon nigroviridis]